MTDMNLVGNGTRSRPATSPAAGTAPGGSPEVQRSQLGVGTQFLENISRMLQRAPATEPELRRKALIEIVDQILSDPAFLLASAHRKDCELGFKPVEKGEGGGVNNRLVQAVDFDPPSDLGAWMNSARQRNLTLSQVASVLNRESGGGAIIEERVPGLLKFMLGVKQQEGTAESSFVAARFPFGARVTSSIDIEFGPRLSGDSKLSGLETEVPRGLLEDYLLKLTVLQSVQRFYCFDSAQEVARQTVASTGFFQRARRDGAKEILHQLAEYSYNLRAFPGGLLYDAVEEEGALKVLAGAVRSYPDEIFRVDGMETLRTLIADLRVMAQVYAGSHPELQERIKNEALITWDRVKAPLGKVIKGMRRLALNSAFIMDDPAQSVKERALGHLRAAVKELNLAELTSSLRRGMTKVGAPADPCIDALSIGVDKRYTDFDRSLSELLSSLDEQQYQPKQGLMDTFSAHLAQVSSDLSAEQQAEIARQLSPFIIRECVKLRALWAGSGRFERRECDKVLGRFQDLCRDSANSAVAQGGLDEAGARKLQADLEAFSTTIESYWREGESDAAVSSFNIGLRRPSIQMN